MLAGAVALLLVIGLPSAWAKGGRLERIHAEKALRVCIEPGYYGISFREPSSGRVSGLDADLAREFARDLGVEPQFVDSSFAGFGNDLAGGRCDLSVIPASVPKGGSLRLAPPHLRSPLYGVASKGSTIRWEDLDRKGMVIAVAKGTPVEPLVRARLRKAALLAMDVPLSRIPEMKPELTDVMVTDYPYGQYLSQSVADRAVAPLGDGVLLSYSWSVAAGDERWYARVEHFIHEIKKDGRLLTAARRHRLEPIISLD